MKEIGETIARVSEIAASISAAVEQQGAATNEIARNVQQAAQGTTQLATNIAEVDRGADARRLRIEPTSCPRRSCCRAKATG